MFRGRVFYERDLQLDWYTQMESFVRSVTRGSWPLWDNTIAFGQPLLADPSAQILYPLTWLNLVMQPWWYYTVFVVFHAALAGVGLRLLGRHLGLTPLASLLAGGLWITSGPFVSMVNLWHHLATAAWMPWVLLAADRALEEPRARRTAIWGAMAGCQLVAGSADVWAMTMLLSSGLVVRRIEWRAGIASHRRLLSHAVLAATLAAVVAAAVWVPALAIARRSSRWNYPEGVRNAWSVSPGSLPGLFLPLSDPALRLLLPEGVAPAADAPDPLLASIYLGLPALALVAAALATRRRPWRGPLAASLAVALLASLGSHTPLLGWMLSLLPALKVFRYPSKAMIVASLAWALLAGLGLDAWSEEASARSRPGRGWLLATWLPLAVAALAFGLSGAAGVASLAGAERAHVAEAVAASVALALLVRWGAGPPATGAAALLVLGDLVLAHRGLNRTAQAGLVSFRPPVVDAMAPGDHARVYVYDYQTEGSSSRYLGRDDPYMIRTPPPGTSLEATQVLSQRLYPFPPVGGRWGLEGSYDLDFRGLYPLPLATMVQDLRRVEGTPAHRRLLQVGAVGTVVSLHSAGLEDLDPETTVPSLFPEPIHVRRVPGALPRAYAVGGSRIADGDLALAALVDPGFDPAREVVLPEGIPETPASSFGGRVRLDSLLPDRVDISADLTAPGYVVLVDSYDPGWRVTVDGTEAPLLRANIAFRAVRVPAGTHRVAMLYRPREVLWGLLVSAAGVVVVAAILRRPGAATI